MTRLRLAEEADIPTLIEMGTGMLAGSSFAPMAYAPDKVAEFFRKAIGGTALLAVTVEDDGTLTGAICGDVVEPWYSHDRMGIEFFVYVRPEFRGSRAAIMLIKAWVRWCIDSGVTQVRPGTAAVSEQADRLYRGLGFKPAGSLYVLDKEQFDGK